MKRNHKFVMLALFLLMVLSLSSIAFGVDYYYIGSKDSSDYYTTSDNKFVSFKTGTTVSEQTTGGISAGSLDLYKTNGAVDYNTIVKSLELSPSNSNLQKSYPVPSSYLNAPVAPASTPSATVPAAPVAATPAAPVATAPAAPVATAPAAPVATAPAAPVATTPAAPVATTPAANPNRQYFSFIDTTGYHSSSSYPTYAFSVNSQNGIDYYDSTSKTWVPVNDKTSFPQSSNSNINDALTEMRRIAQLPVDGRNGAIRGIVSQVNTDEVSKGGVQNNIAIAVSKTEGVPGSSDLSTLEVLGGDTPAGSAASWSDLFSRDSGVDAIGANKLTEVLKTFIQAKPVEQVPKPGSEDKPLVVADPVVLTLQKQVSDINLKLANLEASKAQADTAAKRLAIDKDINALRVERQAVELELSGKLKAPNDPAKNAEEFLKKLGTKTPVDSNTGVQSGSNPKNNFNGIKTLENGAKYIQSGTLIYTFDQTGQLDKVYDSATEKMSDVTPDQKGAFKIAGAGAGLDNQGNVLNAQKETVSYKKGDAFATIGTGEKSYLQSTEGGYKLVPITTDGGNYVLQDSYGNQLSKDNFVKTDAKDALNHRLLDAYVASGRKDEISKDALTQYEIVTENPDDISGYNDKLKSLPKGAIFFEEINNRYSSNNDDSSGNLVTTSFLSKATRSTSYTNPEGDKVTSTWTMTDKGPVLNDYEGKVDGQQLTIKSIPGGFTTNVNGLEYGFSGRTVTIGGVPRPDLEYVGGEFKVKSTNKKPGEDLKEEVRNLNKNVASRITSGGLQAGLDISKNMAADQIRSRANLLAGTKPGVEAPVWAKNIATGYQYLQVMSGIAQGFSGYSSLFASSESIQEWKLNVDKAFNKWTTNALVESICAKKFKQAGVQSAFVKVPGNAIIPAATVAAECVVAADPLTGEKNNMYKLTLHVSNPQSTSTYTSMKYDVTLYGDQTVPLFNEPKVLQRGESYTLSREQRILFSSHTYDKICIVFDEPPEMFKGSEVCNKIACVAPDVTEYESGASSIDIYITQMQAQNKSTTTNAQANSTSLFNPNI